MNGCILQLKKLWAMLWCASEDKFIFGDHTCGFGYWMRYDLCQLTKEILMFKSIEIFQM
jgi:hypothetical protein